MIHSFIDLKNIKCNLVLKIINLLELAVNQMLCFFLLELLLNLNDVKAVLNSSKLNLDYFLHIR